MSSRKSKRQRDQEFIDGLDYGKDVTDLLDQYKKRKVQKKEESIEDEDSPGILKKSLKNSSRVMIEFMKKTGEVAKYLTKETLHMMVKLSETVAYSILGVAASTVASTAISFGLWAVTNPIKFAAMYAAYKSGGMGFLYRHDMIPGAQRIAAFLNQNMAKLGEKLSTKLLNNSISRNFDWHEKFGNWWKKKVNLGEISVAKEKSVYGDAAMFENRLKRAQEAATEKYGAEDAAGRNIGSKMKKVQTKLRAVRDKFSQWKSNAVQLKEDTKSWFNNMKSKFAGKKGVEEIPDLEGMSVEEMLDTFKKFQGLDEEGPLLDEDGDIIDDNEVFEDADPIPDNMLDEDVFEDADPIPDDVVEPVPDSGEGLGFDLEEGAPKPEPIPPQVDVDNLPSAIDEPIGEPGGGVLSGEVGEVAEVAGEVGEVGRVASVGNKAKNFLQNQGKGTVEIPLRVANWMAQRGGKVGAVGTKIMQTAAGANETGVLGTVETVTGGVTVGLSMLSVGLDGMTMAEALKTKADLKKYMKSLPADDPDTEFIRDWYKRESTHADIAEGSFGVNTVLTAGSFLPPPFNFVAMGLGAIARQAESVAGDVYNWKEHKAFLRKWYGSDENPSYAYYLSKRDKSGSLRAVYDRVMNHQNSGNSDIDKVYDQLKLKLQDSTVGHAGYTDARFERTLASLNYGSFGEKNRYKHGQVGGSFKDSPGITTKTLDALEAFIKRYPGGISTVDGLLDSAKDEEIHKNQSGDYSWEYYDKHNETIDKEHLIRQHKMEEYRKAQQEYALAHKDQLQANYRDSLNRAGIGTDLMAMGGSADEGRLKHTHLRGFQYQIDESLFKNIYADKDESPSGTMTISTSGNRSTELQKTHGGKENEVNKTQNTSYGKNASLFHADSGMRGNESGGKHQTTGKELVVYGAQVSQTPGNDGHTAHLSDEQVFQCHTGHGWGTSSQEKGVHSGKQVAVVHLGDHDGRRGSDGTYRTDDALTHVGAYHIAHQGNAVAFPRETPIHEVTPGESRNPFMHNNHQTIAPNNGPRMTFREAVQEMQVATVVGQRRMTANAHINFMQALNERELRT